MTRSTWRLLLAGMVLGTQGMPAIAGETCTRLSAPDVWLGYKGNGGEVNVYSAFPPRNLGFGTSAADALVLETFDGTTGTIDLSQNGNDNYATCTQCLTLSIDALTPTPTIHLAVEGFIELSAVPGAPTLPLDLIGVRMIEVTIDQETFQSIPVPGGRCVRVDASLLFEDGMEPY